jgi:hypothetical protein
MSESVSFILKSTSINLDNAVANYYNQIISNNIGTVAQNRSSITWNNVNLKNLLGEMYDRYERFNINLNFICGARTGTTAEANADNRTYYVRMRGLNFTSSYDQKTGNNDNSVVLTSLRIPITANSVWDFSNFTTQYFTFRKQDMVNINIDLITVATDTYYVPISNAAMIGHIIYSFSITGVEDYKNIEKSENQNVDLELRKIF